jgi:hypothetical protein
MKKLLYLFFSITLLGCGSDDEEIILGCIDSTLIDLDVLPIKINDYK